MTPAFPLGQVATKIVYSGTSESVMYSYVYDAAGHVVQLTTAAVDANGYPLSGGPAAVVDTYGWDAQGRLTKMVQNAGGSDATANRTTTYAYSFDGTYNVTTITYPDGTTEIHKSYLDGSPASVSGTAVASPSTYDEGVIASDTSDANGNTETAGSTWSKVSTDGGANWTQSFTNTLGQQYLVQQSGPTTSIVSGTTGGSYADQLTSFDGNDRPNKTVGFDDTWTLEVYDPLTGQEAATVTDLNRNGTYDPGIDRKTVLHAELNNHNNDALPASDSDQAGTDSTDLSSSGNQDDTSQSWNGGLNSTQTVDGQTTTDTVSKPTGPGAYTDTVQNPDKTEVVDTYAAGLLTQEQSLGSDGTTVLWTKTFGYDGLRRLASVTDYTGKTTYGYFQDGTLASTTLPGHAAQTVNTIDAKTEQPTDVTLADGQHTLLQGKSISKTSERSGVLGLYKSIGKLRSR